MGSEENPFVSYGYVKKRKKEKFFSQKSTLNKVQILNIRIFFCVCKSSAELCNREEENSSSNTDLSSIRRKEFTIKVHHIFS